MRTAVQLTCAFCHGHFIERHRDGFTAGQIYVANCPRCHTINPFKVGDEDGLKAEAAAVKPSSLTRTAG